LVHYNTVDEVARFREALSSVAAAAHAEITTRA
jgi:selenocysteine lyase/cysteine desulfurase